MTDPDRTLESARPAPDQPTPNLVASDLLADAIARRLVADALPAEVQGFGPAEQADAAAFVAGAAAERAPGQARVALEAIAGDDVRRRMRIAVVNDDMPFLVDSIAAAIGAHNVAVDRIIHPVLPVTRDADGRAVSVGENGNRESMIYIEAERVDARERRSLADDLETVLRDVRAAVEDWPAMRRRLADDARALPEGKHRDLTLWLAADRFTLLGHQLFAGTDAATNDALGLSRLPHAEAVIGPASLDRARQWFADGGDAPLLLKSNLISPVHRALPLDLIVLPAGDGGLSVHAGLWTSAALAAAPGDVPVLRHRMDAIADRFGLDPRGHAGKALAHALGALPHDLSVSFDAADLEGLALTAMSLADRPRPKLVLVRSRLGGKLFAFAWLPRDELTTARRAAVAQMLEEEADARVLDWTIQLDDVVALIRYTLDLSDYDTAREYDADALDRRLGRMVRGWAPNVEAALAEDLPAPRAARLALRWANAFPIGYRNASTPEEAAHDIRRLGTLDGPDARSVRLFPIVQGDDLHFKIYRLGGALPLSDVVPVLENFGFRVIGELPTRVEGDELAFVHEFVVEANAAVAAVEAAALERAIEAVLEGRAENDQFNRLLVETGLAADGVVWLRAWFRYLRQTGLTYGLSTVVDALRRAPAVATGLIARFAAAHGPGGSDAGMAQADAAIAKGLDGVAAIDDDRILRGLRDVVAATLRTNAFVPAGAEALAFKLNSSLVPGLPVPVPWREVWVYSPRVEGIHLRAGPVARGGLRWSDRRDDFRTEILGLMKAQRVKNAVIVPTGAKGGFYPKQLPPANDRDAWAAEGTESYRVFIRALLSITDNIVDGHVVHPDGVRAPDGDDPYFVVAADKGTATFSDVANALALERGFWLGDAFASGGSVGYDHKAMGITARGAWVSVQRHFAETGVDVQSDPITVAGCGDMSGDVFGNGMLLSRTIRLVAAFDHRHIFLDPDPDPETSFAERERLFALPRSSWADYAAPVSAGGGVHSRAAKSITLTPEVRTLLGVSATQLEPNALIAAILRARVDLLWFGGIGTYVKAAAEANVAVGDPANDRLRVDAESLRAAAVGEGANLGLTQAARIAFAAAGGRINTDFIDNSAGVDCSDNEVNIKIALNREVVEGRLALDDRNAFLAAMTDDVAALVLEDNRLQTLALSIAEADGAAALPGYVRAIEMFEGSGRLDRAVEGLASDQELLRRGQEGHGLTRPELAVLLATAKLAVQDAVERSDLGLAAELVPDLRATFPPAMRERFADAIDAHRLRAQIVATDLANRMVNRLGILHPLELAEEEGASFADVAAMFVVAERLFDLAGLWAAIEAGTMPERGRIALFKAAARATRNHLADLLRSASSGTLPGVALERLRPGVDRLAAQTDELLMDEARAYSAAIAAALTDAGAPADLAERVAWLFDMDGAVGIAGLAQRMGLGEEPLARAFTRLGQALGLDWAQGAAGRLAPADPWERLLLSGMARDFEQLRLDFLARFDGQEPHAATETWLERNAARVAQFRGLVERARGAGQQTTAMLAQIANQARVLLGR